MNDADYFVFHQEAAGEVTINVNVLDSYANLDAKVELRDKYNRLVAMSDPGDSLDAKITRNLPVGTYYVVVKSHGGLWRRRQLHRHRRRSQG